MNTKLVASTVVGMLLAGGLAYAAVGSDSFAGFAESLRGAAASRRQAAGDSVQFVLGGVALANVQSASGCTQVAETPAGSGRPQPTVEPCTIVFTGRVERPLALWVADAMAGRDSTETNMPTVGLKFLSRDGKSDGGVTFQRALLTSFSAPAFDAASRDVATHTITFQAARAVVGAAPPVESHAGGGRGQLGESAHFATDLTRDAVQISSIGFERELIAMRESTPDGGTQIVHNPGRVTLADVEIAVLAGRDADRLVTWHDDHVEGRDARKDVVVEQRDARGRLGTLYELHDAVPERLSVVDWSLSSSTAPRTIKLTLAVDTLVVR